LIFTTLISWMLNFLFSPNEEIRYIIPILIFIILISPFVLSFLRFRLKHKVQHLYLKNWSKLFILSYWKGEILALMLTVTLHWISAFALGLKHSILLFLILLFISQYICYLTISNQLKIYLKITKNLQL